MPELWLAWLAILAGFGGLIWSADRFVGGSAAIASNFGISRLIVGLTIVSLGTSAPEIIVAISASLKGSGDLAVGNALGSNLANIGLVLAITALIAPMPIQKHLLTQEVPILLAVTLLAGYTLWDAKLVEWEGALLLGCLIPLLYFMIRTKQQHPEEGEDSDIPEMSTGAASLWFVLGLTALIASSEALVWGAQIVATSFGVSPLIIGLTVIAVGTSLPELAASVMSALKGHHDMALGNIIGSNIFNILAVMSVPGLIHPPEMDESVFSRDFLAMGAVTLVLAAAVTVDYWLRNRQTSGNGTARLGRRIGVLLLACYIGYYYLLFS
ncbi:MAG: calcium/sodium antiporter [Cellvibrionaceae bacterium]|nr:calcium/sodium antiporter [Cellvibrionaceae bacterium]|tara:strand:- start:15901 stop:16878 length:978 start_codon:yes stop_codon:yes gene_type:complete